MASPNPNSATAKLAAARDAAAKRGPTIATQAPTEVTGPRRATVNTGPSARSNNARNVTPSVSTRSANAPTRTVAAPPATVRRVAAPPTTNRPTVQPRAATANMAPVRQAVAARNVPAAKAEARATKSRVTSPTNKAAAKASNTRANTKPTKIVQDAVSGRAVARATRQAAAPAPAPQRASRTVAAPPTAKAKPARAPRPAPLPAPEPAEVRPVGRPITDLHYQIVAEFEAGWTRAQLMEKYNLTYSAIYFHTKDAVAPEGSDQGNRARVFLEDGRSRRDAMREDFLAGMTIGDIGRTYETNYQTAYQAVKDLIDRS